MDYYFDFLDWFYGSGGGSIVTVLKFISGFFSIVMAVLLAYVIRLTWTLGSPLKKAEEVFKLDFGKIPASSKKEASKQWESIVAKAASPAESDWKLAVIEADALVDELLKLAQYPGETMGDRLKQLDTSKLAALQDLWEAHKVRNIIAHNPSQQLTKEEIDKAIEGFRKALDELEFIV